MVALGSMGPFQDLCLEAASRRLSCGESKLRSMLNRGKWELRGDGGDTGGTRLALYENEQKGRRHRKTLQLWV